MLYAIIQYVTTTILFMLGRSTVHGGYFEPNITILHDIHCGSEYNNICAINCTFSFDEDSWTTAKFPNIYCGNATKCIIFCSEDFCLRDTIIHAKHTTHVAITSQANGCLQSAQLYLPNNGNATIIGHTNGLYNDTLRAMQIYSGTDTNTIAISCTDATYADMHNDCDSLQIQAQTAQYLSITISGSSFRNSSVYCPESSALSPSCVINADRAQTTENLHIYAPKGMPHDVMFHSNNVANITSIYSGTVITCFNGNYSSIIHNNTFIGTPCFITASLTSDPTVDPTVEPTTEPTVESTLESIYISSIQNDDNKNPPTGTIKSILNIISLNLLLVILCGLTVLAGCCIIVLCILNKRKQKHVDKKQIERLYSTDPGPVEKAHAVANDVQAAQNKQNDLADAPKAMENVAEVRLNSNDVIAITAGGDMISPMQQYMDHVTRLPPPVPRNASSKESGEFIQNMEDGYDTQPIANEEDIKDDEDDEDSDSDDDDEGDDAVVNIVVSSVVDAKHYNVASKSEFEPIENEVKEEDSNSWSESTQNNDHEQNLVTKGATTKGDSSDSDSSFSSESVKGGLTDIGDLVVGGAQQNVGEADDEDLLVGEVGSF